MKKTILAVAAIATLILASCGGNAAQTEAQTPKVNIGEPVALYDGTAPGSEDWNYEELEVPNPFTPEEKMAMNVVKPTIQAYLPEADKATGAAMVVCPGGAYLALSVESEGSFVAQWLAEHGIAAFVLKYRTAYTGATNEEALDTYMGIFKGFSADPAEKEAAEATMKELHKKLEVVTPLAHNDGRKAMEYVREHAAEFNINPDKIGIVGFSAGTGPTLDVAFNHTEESKPNFVAAIYGGREATEIPADAAPLFIAAPQFDIFGAPTAENLFNLWHANGKLAELHYFAGTGHGFGYRPNGDPVYVWIKLMHDFMIKSEFITAEYLLQ